MSLDFHSRRSLCFLLLLFFTQDLCAQEPRKLETYQDFHAPGYEYKCFHYFDDTASGINNVNAFFLAKMSELMYLERLDYQLRYFENDGCEVDTIQSSEWLAEHCKVTDENFGAMFKKRFQHYFDGPFESEDEHGEHRRDEGADEHIRFKYIQKKHTNNYRILGMHFQSGLDPELMVISTPETILIVFRGTDEVGDSEWAEWLGTDFRLNQSNAGGALIGTKVHTGFWLSFDLIRDELMSTLTSFDAEHKNIWLAGHSLGAALAIISGVYLKSYGLNVQNVYSYAGPRTLGNWKFRKKANELLPNRIQRFEYYQDPVTMAWLPGFRYHHIGQRNWFDEEELGEFKLYPNTKERRFIGRPMKKYPALDSIQNKKEARRIKSTQFSGSTLVGTSMLKYHNPQYYVKATYHQLTEEEQKHLPNVDDSYPYLYFYRKDSK